LNDELAVADIQLLNYCSDY